jgi:hypothetical protein
MKKQLLIAAVAATFTSVAMADISISGAAKFNATDGVYNHEADLTIAGKSGDTSVTANVSLDLSTAGGEFDVEDLYVSTAVAGVNVKMGGWRSGKSELNTTSATVERVNISTSFGGLSLAYEDSNTSNSTTIGGSLAGVAVSHKIKQSKDTETKASGSIGGVSVAVFNKESAGGNNTTSTTLSTEVQGVTLTYSRIDSDAGTASDGYIGKSALAVDGAACASVAKAGCILEADVIGVKTSISGNTVQFKAVTIDGTDTNKVIVTRALGAGATFEATYSDTDLVDATLDLELAVKF